MTIYDLAQMNVSSTGTGTITLNANIAGSQTFANAGLANNGTSSYGISDTGGAYEYGQGTYVTNSSGNFWARTTVVGSSNNSTTGGAASPINMSGAAIVYTTFLDLDYNNWSSNSTGYLSVGNSTVNSYGNSTIDILANSTSQTVITSSSISFGNSTSNLVVNSSSFNLSNSTQSVIITTTGIPAPTAGRLANFGGANPFAQLQFVPWRGNLLMISGQCYQIPTGVLESSGGVFANCANCYVAGTPNSVLANNFFYYIYMFLNSGTMTMNFANTTYVTNTDFGYHHMSGNSGQALIGMCYTSSAGQFLGNGSYQCTSSFFNRVRIGLQVALPASTLTTSTTFTEINSGDRLGWVQWSEEVPEVRVDASPYNNTAGAGTYVGIGLNSTSATGFQGSYQSPIANYNGGAAAFTDGAVGTEGYVYAAFLMKVSSGAGALISGMMSASPIPS
jgi:hypothetical protein